MTKMTKSNKAQMTTTMQSNSITIVAWHSNKCMANYLNETDDKYCLILISNVRSDIWCGASGVYFRDHVSRVTRLFADMPIRGQTIRGQDNSRTRLFADTTIRGLWTIRGKTFHGQAGLLADKLFEVTALPVASSWWAGARCPVACQRRAQGFYNAISYYYAPAP